MKSDMIATSENGSSTSKPKLQLVNIANIAAYFVNMIITYGVGVSGKFPTNAELSEKYQTLVTPAPYAFSIWAIIFISQLVWAICQLLPAFRSKELVVKGVGYNYVLVCLAQAIWSFLFAAEKMTLSLFAMISILIPLILILSKTSEIPSPSTGQYWLCKFPFEIHAAWIMAATLVNFNVVLVAMKTSASIQTYFGWGSLVLLTIAAFFYIYKEKWVVPCVLAWASYAIKAGLAKPNELILSTFSSHVIDTTQLAAEIVSIAILVTAVLKFAYKQYILARDSNDAESDAYTSMEDEQV